MRRLLAISFVAVLAGLSGCGSSQSEWQTAGSDGAAASGVQPAAQSGNPGFMAPESEAGDAADMPNNVDVLFARQAALGGLAEVELGELAAQKGSDEDVVAFARRMVADHNKANDRLKALAADNGIPLPTRLDDDFERKRDGLEALSGAEFDMVYIRGQIQDHQRTAQLLEHEIGSGQDAAIKRFAMDSLPVVLGHLEMAKTIAARLASTAER